MDPGPVSNRGEEVLPCRPGRTFNYLEGEPAAGLCRGDFVVAREGPAGCPLEGPVSRPILRDGLVLSHTLCAATFSPAVPAAG